MHIRFILILICVQFNFVQEFQNMLNSFSFVKFLIQIFDRGSLNIEAEKR